MPAHNKTIPFRIAIAVNNTPWGVTKHPTLGNQYHHTVSFTDAALKDAYINKHLFADGDYKALLNDKANEFATYYVDDRKFKFSVSTENYNSLDELLNKDFCAVKKPEDDKYYFYTLEVIASSAGQVQFLAELDVFFTLDMDEVLSSTRLSYVQNAHIDRYNESGAPNFEAILKNKELPYEASKIATVGTPAPITSIDKSIDPNQPDETRRDQFDFRWLVIYVKNDELANVGFKNYFYNKKKRTFHPDITEAVETWRGTSRLPYTILLAPFSTDEAKGEIKLWLDGIHFTYSMDWVENMLFNLGDKIIAVHQKDSYELGIKLLNSFQIRAKNNTIEFEQNEHWENIGIKCKQIKLIDNGLQDRFNETARGKKLLDEIDADTNIRLYWEQQYNRELKAYMEANRDSVAAIEPEDAIFWVRDVNKLLTDGDDIIGGQRVTLDHLGKELWKNERNEWTNVEDPILYHPSIYNVEIKKWNTEGKKYGLPFFSVVSGQCELNVLYSWEPTSDTNILWLTPNTHYNPETLVAGDVLQITNTESWPTRQDQFQAYLRDHKNAFDTGHEQAKAMARFDLFSSALNVAGASVGLTAAGSSENNVVAGGAIFALGRSYANYHGAGLRLQHIDQMRAATISDYQNRPGIISTGSTGNMSLFVGKIKAHGDGVQVIERTLHANEKEQLLGYVKRYGYTVADFVNIRKLRKTRKRYNYIEAYGVFNDITANHSPAIKQVINDAYAIGVTNWHIKSIDDEIKRYDLPNPEVVQHKKKKREAEGD